jgi:hypothetical protein
LAPGTTTKSIPLTVNGATATSSVTYSFAPATTAGYYTFSATFSGFTPGTSEKIGVVTTDLYHNNFVLSEGQTASAITVPAGGLAVPTALTLAPVVDGVYVVPPTVITSLTGSSLTNPPTLGTLESTVFATDELGFVIPTILNAAGTARAVAPENTPTITITPATAGALTFKDYTFTNTPAALTATSLTSFPVTATLAAASQLAGSFVISDASSDTAFTGTLYEGVTGTLLQNITTPSGPYTVATNGATITPNGSVTGSVTNSAGTPVNITCTTSSSSVAWNAVITSAVTSPTAVVGYTYTSSNYPAATNASIPLTPINCTPGFAVPIN